MNNQIRKSTMVELVEELRALPKSPGIDLMIEEALAGEYHDYKNVKYICGKLESSARLRSLGHPELAKRIEQGEFDEEADAADEEMLRNHLAEGNLSQLEEMFGLSKKTNN